MTGQEMTNWNEQLANEAKALAKTERPSVQRFSFKAGIMQINEQPVPGNKIDVAIVASLHENVYYKEAFDADVVRPPTCYAYSPDGIDMVPHPDIKEPQHPTCEGCWASKFKSAENGKGKACKERRKLAVMPAYKELADYTKGELAVMSLPTMSVKNWSNYVNFLSSNVQRAPWGVKTTVGIVPDVKTQFKVIFAPVEKFEDDFLAAIHPKIQAGKDLLEVPYDLTPPEEREDEEPTKPGKKVKY